MSSTTIICARTADGAELAGDWLRLAMCSGPGTDGQRVNDRYTRRQLGERARGLAKTERLELLGLGEREAVL